MQDPEYTFVDGAGNLFFAPDELPIWWQAGQYVRYQKNKKNPQPNLIFWHRSAWSPGIVKIPEGLVINIPHSLLPPGKYEVLKQSDECVFLVKIDEAFTRTAENTKREYTNANTGEAENKGWKNAPDLSDVKNLKRQDYAYAFMQGVSDFIRGDLSQWKWQCVRGDLLTILEKWDMFKPPRQCALEEKKATPAKTEVEMLHDIIASESSRPLDKMKAQERLNEINAEQGNATNSYNPEPIIKEI